MRAVGRAAEIARSLPPGTPVYELPGAWITPGFVDGHTHFAAWALGRRRVQLVGAGTRAEAVRRVAAATPVQGWVLGHGWDANDWEAPPQRQALDAVQPGPVFLDSLDVHAAWLNTPALAAAGITRATPDPFGGRIVRDTSGEPTGLLQERAVELALPALPMPPDDLLAGALIDAQSEAHRLGVTGIHDVEGDHVFRAFSRLDREQRLRLRVLFSPPVASLPRLVAERAMSGQGTEWLTTGAVKLFLDGSLGTQTAWMLDPYEGSRDRGMPLSTLEQARDAMLTAARAGLALSVHAIGDAAARRALDLLAAVPRVAIPHRIEHLQCVHPADLGRAAALGLVASMQPAHLLTDIRLVERHWGARGAGAYAFRRLLRAGTALAFGSDVPVAPLDPREGVFAAMQRTGPDGSPAAGWYPEERLEFEEAVRAYTLGNAHAAGVAHRRGVLAPGYDADLVAWEADPALARGQGAAFRHARARLTVVGGEAVMQA
ncbi:MAG TPA: amidohydrolase [Gemmatimonadales bacterium]|nr:amidohydrolase [Gemmatimonadales bacterium]